MTTQIGAPTPLVRPAFPRAVHLEWIKLRSLRSTQLAVAATVVAMAALAGVTAANTANRHADTTSNVLVGLLLGQVVFGVLGVLAATSEYSTGLIRTTLLAVPRRPTLLAAKAAVFAAAALVAGEIATFTAFLVGSAFFRGGVDVASLSDPGVARAVALSGAYLALVGLIGLGIGAALRHGPAAIAALSAVLFVAPLIPFGRDVARFLPEMIAANSLSAVQPVRGFTLSPWVEIVVVAGYAAVALGTAVVLLGRRDA